MTSHFRLTDLAGLRANHVIASIASHRGHQAVRLVLAPDAVTPDNPNFAIIEGLDFANGSIEVQLASQVLAEFGPEPRGFIGIAFRISSGLGKFEGVYLRPKNARETAQIRRNRSVQYFSYPGFKFDRLRKEAPGEYETYVDLELGAWTRLRIEVEGDKARVYVHDAVQPTLIVNDLKHGADARGAIGLFLDRGTEAFFRDLKVTPK